MARIVTGEMDNYLRLSLCYSTNPGQRYVSMGMLTEYPSPEDALDALEITVRAMRQALKRDRDEQTEDYKRASGERLHSAGAAPICTGAE